MRALVLFMLALAVTGCGRANHENPVPAATLSAAPETSAALPSGPASPTASAAAPSGAAGNPERLSIDPGKPETLIARWRQALETHDYGAAWRMFGHGGAASGMTAPAFAAAWDKYRVIDITPGPGEQEGAAGSLYYEAPVSVTGLRRDGAPYHLSGTITLRRVNDVDGASPEQLAWHIERTTLRP